VIELKVIELYEELLGPEEDWDANQDRVSEALVELVIEAAESLAESINSCSANEQIRWLLNQGVSVEGIKEYVGRIK